jgi:hypothetical protein
MGVTKLILNGSVLILNPGGTPNPEIDFTSLIKEVSIQPKRASVNVSAHGDPADTFGKGGGQHMMTINWFYPAALGALLPALLGELNADTPTPFSMFFAPGSVAVNNPNITGAVSIHDLGKIGGARNAAMEGSSTLPIDGQCTYKVGGSPADFLF